jgi:hypothetical protein
MTHDERMILEEFFEWFSQHRTAFKLRDEIRIRSGDLCPLQVLTGTSIGYTSITDQMGLPTREIIDAVDNVKPYSDTARAIRLRLLQEMQRV